MNILFKEKLLLREIKNKIFNEDTVYFDGGNKLFKLKNFFNLGF